MALQQMPFEYYGYYFLYEPFITGYLEIGEEEKAMELWEKVAAKYRDNLEYYSTLNLDRQYEYVDVILQEIDQYRSLVSLLVENNREEVAQKKVEEYNRYLQLFSHFFEEIPK